MTRTRLIARSQLRRSLTASVAEGTLAETFSACAGSTVLTGWILHLGGGPLAVGVLGALPFLMQFVHWPGAWLVSLFGRRRVALLAVAISRQAYWPLVVLPFLHIPPTTKLTMLLVAAGLSSLLAVVGNNAWVAWMSDLVPRSLRGRFFGRRTAWCTICGTLAAVLAGIALDRARGLGAQELALAGLIIAAGAMGAASTWLMHQQHDPLVRNENRGPTLAPHLSLFLRPFADPQARPVLAYQVGWNVAVGLASSFFLVHMLKNLQMGFTLVALQGMGVALVRALAVPLWGKAIDRAGAQRVLVICSFGIASIPIIWLFPTPYFLWPLLLDALASGILWSGHGLASFTLPLEIGPREARPFYLAAFAAVGGLAFAASSVWGGLLAQAIPSHLLVLGHPMFGLQILFVLSAVARLTAALLTLRIVEPGRLAASERKNLSMPRLQGHTLPVP